MSTSPASLVVRDDAAYFLEWIDRLEERFASGDRVPSPQMRAHVKGQLDAARAVYRKVGLVTMAHGGGGGGGGGGSGGSGARDSGERLRPERPST